MAVTKHDVFEAVRGVLSKGRAPTQGELEKAVGLHWSAIKQHLLRLKAEGVVAWEPGDYTTMKLGRALPKADKNAPKPAKTAAPRRPRLVPAVAVAEVAAALPQAPAAPAEPTGRRYVDADAVSRAHAMLLSAADILATALEVAIAPRDLVQALLAKLDEDAPVTAAPVVAVSVAAPAARVARGKRPKVKRFRVEDGLGNELGAFDTISEARRLYDRDDDAIKLVDTTDSSIIASRRAPSDEEE